MRLVTCFRLSPSADVNAVQKERLRIRCAAHSDWISLPGMPHTFSVYSRKNAL